MKRNNMFTMIIVMIFALVAMVIIKSKVHQQNSASTTTTLQPEGKKYRVAILLQLSHPALDEIMQGFLDTLNGQISYDYDLYNANGDRTLLRKQAEEIAVKQYDLICTIPTTPSLIMKEVTQQRGITTPIVATAVNDPVGLQLVNSMQNSGNNVTAVTGIETFKQQIDILKFLKPNLKKILLVYNPTQGLDQKKAEIEQICHNANINFKTVEIFNINDLSSKVPAFIHDCDTIMVLKDNMVVSGIEGLVTLCNKHHKTLYASDLNSGDKGAALSYGVHEYQDGVEAAHKAIEILKHHKKPSDVASSATMGFKIKINTSTMQQQDLHFDPELLFAMRAGEVQ